MTSTRWYGAHVNFSWIAWLFASLKPFSYVKWLHSFMKLTIVEDLMGLDMIMIKDAFSAKDYWYWIIKTDISDIHFVNLIYRGFLMPNTFAFKIQLVVVSLPNEVWELLSLQCDYFSFLFFFFNELVRRFIQS